MIPLLHRYGLKAAKLPTIAIGSSRNYASNEDSSGLENEDDIAKVHGTHIFFTIYSVNSIRVFRLEMSEDLHSNSTLHFNLNEYRLSRIGVEPEESSDTKETTVSVSCRRPPVRRIQLMFPTSAPLNRFFFSLVLDCRQPQADEGNARLGRRMVGPKVLPSVCRAISDTPRLHQRPKQGLTTARRLRQRRAHENPQFSAFDAAGCEKAMRSHQAILYALAEESGDGRKVRTPLSH